MTAITKDNQRIACYGDIFAVIEKGEVIKRIIIDEQRLKIEINQVIDKNEAPLNPYNIFRKAVENVTGYKYFGNRLTPITPVIEGTKKSIHDQEVYKKFVKYILQNEKMKRIHELYMQNLKVRKEINKKNYIVLGGNNPNFKPKLYYNSH